VAAQTDAPGWFGKLSMLGDFASRRLSSDWIRPCDEWLSASLRTSQERLGERWLATYLATPVWRFAWAPGIVDGHWWFGILMPVATRSAAFPLVVAQQRQYCRSTASRSTTSNAVGPPSCRPDTPADGASSTFSNKPCSTLPWPTATGPA
jgi:type VI secretion system ImpM family protein